MRPCRIGRRQERGELQVAERRSWQLWPSVKPGCVTIGRMVRVMTFQSLFTLIGITGWMFRMFCVPSRGP